MDVGFWEMFVLAVLSLVIFGPERLPGIARSVGQTIGRIRREATATFETLREEADLAELREFNTELQREREELTSITTLDERGANGRARPSGPPRYDPQST